MAAITHHPKDFLSACQTERERIRTQIQHLSSTLRSGQSLTPAQDLFASSLKGLKDATEEERELKEGDFYSLTRRVWEEIRTSTMIHWLESSIKTHHFAGFYFELAVIHCEKEANPLAKKRKSAMEWIPLLEAGKLLVELDAACFDDPKALERAHQIDAFYREVFAKAYFGKEGHSFKEVLEQVDKALMREPINWAVREAALKAISEESSPQPLWLASHLPLSSQNEWSQRREAYAIKQLGPSFHKR